MSRLSLIALAILFVRSTVLVACGPDFPNSVLGSDETVLAAPVASFADELRRICAGHLPVFAAAVPTNGPAAQTVDADLADVRAATKDERVVTGYAEARSLLRQDAIPAGLPAEFEDYLRGAIAFRQERISEARAIWEALLRRPAAERRYRSTWAAFMLGKTEADPVKACGWFEKTRELARAGFVDSLGLAASSIGWQAKVELGRGRLEDATKLYLAQLATGDPTAVESLQSVAGKLLAVDVDRLRRVVNDEMLQRVVTAFIVARGGLYAPAQVEAWLRAVEASRKRELAGVERLAWAAYQAGQWDMARRWVECAPVSSPVSQWVRAKLLLRDGKIPAAVKLLGKLVRQFPRADDWAGAATRWEPYISHTAPMMVFGELGALQLARGQYTESLDLLRRGGYWLDAAYVAERVLTPEELMAYVRGNSSAVTDDLRRLLTRRLTRLERFNEASEFVDDDLREELDRYVTGLNMGRDMTLPASRRATALWSAARTAREWGLGLLSTELDPDWHYAGGSFDLGTVNRFEARSILTGASRDELTRSETHCVMDDRRWHYRYVAAELAWEAARLMPDQSDDTACVLQTAGSWLKKSDPLAADRFYKALVRRCGTTALGQEADRLRWFPKLDCH